MWKSIVQWSPSIKTPPPPVLKNIPLWRDSIFGRRWCKYHTLSLSTMTTPLQRPLFTSTRAVSLLDGKALRMVKTTGDEMRRDYVFAVLIIMTTREKRSCERDGVLSEAHYLFTARSSVSYLEVAEVLLRRVTQQGEPLMNDLYPKWTSWILEKEDNLLKLVVSLTCDLLKLIVFWREKVENLMIPEVTGRQMLGRKVGSADPAW